MFKLIGRLIVVAFAVLVAAAVAMLVLVTLGSERLVQAVPDARIGNEPIGAAIGAIEHARFFFGLVSASSLVPAVILLAIGEAAGLRSLVYYTLAGGVALTIAPIMAGYSEAALPLSTVLPILATSGFAAGLAYWLIAGRNS